MTTKVVNILKQGVLALLLLAGIIACEGDIRDVGVNIVDNELFTSDGYSSELITYNQNIERRIANNMGQNLIGVYHNDDFGRLEGTVASRILFEDDIDFGENPVIDTIIVDIPYFATNVGTYDGGEPKFELDSIYGQVKVEIGDEEIDNTKPFMLRIYELTTYLNNLDPSDPTQPLNYYTDETYSYNAANLFYEEEFIPSENDTVLYINRPEIIEDPENGIYNVDTIKKLGVAPSIKLPLKEEYFTNNFLNNSAIFESVEAFVEFFNGLYIESSVYMDPDASIMSLGLEQFNYKATMTIYYTNTVNGVRTKQAAEFIFSTAASSGQSNSNVINGKYTRDYSGSNAESVVNNPDVVNGDEQLFVQGAAGSIALIELFTTEDIEDLRSRNLLITNASLTFYVDQSADLSIAPYRMFVYNYDNNTQLPDILLEGLEAYDGVLQKDENGDPYMYKINITDYISNVLAQEDAIEPSVLALKVMNVTDFPEDFTDTEVPDYSWTPKGIVLHGNQSTTIEKRPKLEISFSEISTNN